MRNIDLDGTIQGYHRNIHALDDMAQASRVLQSVSEETSKEYQTSTGKLAAQADQLLA